MITFKQHITEMGNTIKGRMKLKGYLKKATTDKRLIDTADAQSGGLYTKNIHIAARKLKNRISGIDRAKARVNKK